MIIKGPVEALLGRGVTQDDATETFRQFQLILERDVNMGTHVLQWALEKGPLGRWELVAIAFCRHVVELADAGSVLVGKRIDYPCRLLARAQLEAYLCLKYLLNGDRERLALCYHYCQAMHGLSVSRYLLSQVAAPDAADPNFASIYAAMTETAKEQVAGCEKLNADPKWADIRTEYDLKKSGQPSWYSLFGGPPHLRRLAELTGDEASYVFLYKHFSAHMHGERTTEVFTTEPGEMEGLRNGTSVPELVSVMHSMMVGTMHRLVGAVVPERASDYHEWYLKQGRSKLAWMSSVKFDRPHAEDRNG